MKDISITKKQKKIYEISKSQWLAIQRLLEHKYSIQEIKEILKLDINDSNLSDMSWIKLSKGKLSKEILKYIHIFPLNESIKLANDSLFLKKHLFKGIIKQSIYPLFLIALSFVLLIVFSQLILPQMLLMLDSNSNLLQFLLKAINLFSATVVLSVLCVLVLGFILYLKSKQGSINYDTLLRLKRLKEYASYNLILSYQQLLIYKIGTIDILSYIEQLNKGALELALIQEIQRLMSEGNTLVSAIDQSNLSTLAKDFFILGINSNDTSFFLDLFLVKQREDWNDDIKKFNFKMQLFAYGMVATIVFVVYQIMLMPLDMLQTM